MKKILMIAAIALLAVACNKNQKAVKKLDGSWEQTSFKIFYSGTSFELVGTEGFPTTTYTFENCKLKDDEFCNGTITQANESGSVTDAILYRVTDDGTTLEYKDDTSSDTVEKITIEELSKEEATLKIALDFEIVEGEDPIAIEATIILKKK